MWLGHGNGPSKRRPTKQWRKRGRATKEPSLEIQCCGTWHTMKKLIPLCWIFSTKVGAFLCRCFLLVLPFYCTALYCAAFFLVYMSTLGLVLIHSSYLCLFCLGGYNDHHCSQYEPIVRSRFHRRSTIQSANVHRNIVVRF